jgi:hypothetical protein
MARNKFSSPTIKVQITEEARERAIQSNSGGCLIADGIREQYPQFSRIAVDMATIRMTDREKGVRYTYLTPPLAQHCLLAFDQGWRNPVEEVVIKKAVQILPVMAEGPGQKKQRAEHRLERLSSLQMKEAAGEPLDKTEKMILTKSRMEPKPPRERPTARGPREIKVVEGGSSHGVVIRGGEPIPQGPAHPNLLRGRDRHFGAKLADPGQAFNEAVEQALAAKLSPEITTGL